LADYASRLNITYPKQNADPFEDNLDDIDHYLEQQHENETAHDDEISFKTKSRVVYKTRNTPIVIRYIRYNKFTDPENCYRERILLFLPWRNENIDLLGNYTTHYAHYLSKELIIDSKRKQYEHMADIIDEAARRAEADSCGNVAPNTMHTESEDAEQVVHDSDQLAFFNRHRRDFPH
jgi:hypothetical protein